MTISRARHIICILSLLVAGMECMSAGTTQEAQADREEVVESATVDLLPKRKLRDSGKVTFRCRISRYGDRCMLLASVLENDSTMHIVSPGVKLMLADGDSLVLKAERPRACCSEWADGRWYNAAFRLEPSDMEKLKGSGIVSISIYVPGGVVSRDVASGMENAVARQLRSVDKGQ